MMPPCAARVALLLFVIAQVPDVHAGGPKAGPSKSLEFAKDRDHLNAFRKSKDFAGLEQFVDQIEKKWGAETGEAYFELMTTACEMLTTLDFRNDRQGPLGQKHAVIALSKPGPIPARIEWRLVVCLRQHFEHEKGQIRGEEWSRQRTEKSRYWFSALGRLSKEIKRDFDFKNQPPTYVPPPPGAKIRAGDPPQMIQDPVIRKAYMAASEENDKKLTEYARQEELHQLEKQFGKMAEDYLVTTYSMAPSNYAELESSLKQHGISETTASAILKIVDQRIAKNEKIATKQPTTPPVPQDPNAFWMDPRLQKKVTFDDENPAIQPILEKLRAETGVGLTIASDLKYHEPNYGRLGLFKVPAWAVMKVVAHADLTDGRWVKTDDGYRLEGESRALRLPPPRPVWPWVVAAVALVAIAAAGVYRWRFKKSG